MLKLENFKGSDFDQLTAYFANHDFPITIGTEELSVTGARTQPINPW